MEKQLLAFLKEIYPNIYEDVSDYENIIKKIDTLKADEIIKFAQDSSEVAFQYDEYGDYIYGNFGRSVETSYETVIVLLDRVEICLANLNPSQKANKIGKIRPILIVQNDGFNESN